MPAILFGSISSVADTSELQRASFNEAFTRHGLDWQWGRDDYIAMLDSNGGADRVAAYAESRGEQVDAAAVHATKSEIFQERLAEGGIEPRAGVAETVEAAHREGIKLGLVTTTAAENVAALAGALRSSLDLNSFDVVVDSSLVDRPKPDPAAYALALTRLGESAEDCVAIEDNVGGARSAAGAGVRCVAFPNANTAGQEFDDVVGTVEALDFTHLRDLTSRA